MSCLMDEESWSKLLYYISKGLCTPFLGAGAAYGALPLAKDIANQWAEESNYPLEDSDNLPRVAQYIAVKNGDFKWPKHKLADEFKKFPGPDFDQPDEPHAVLAELPLPIYITTNYDGFMKQALIRQNRDPITVVCPWKNELQKQLTPTVFDKGYSPTPEKPVVFHLHGELDMPKSMVLTEDDYVDFLVHITDHFSEVIPGPVQEAFSDSVILFLGYGMADWDFRIMFRALSENVAKSDKRTQVSVQLLPGSTELSADQRQRLQDYLDKYYDHLDIKVLWGTCRNFMSELRRRWEAYRDG